ncbi:uncharacterized protein EI97DRAFT_416491 [Westerdykella ornata]|uniref:GRF-type domain-containing protein n=1 Tax=Westerdykella ornata TaxID=318751 RepID=A0A6A6JRG3_WESOR|nr:uncharacterized protein EI97DRAFT_416491 [Westerdykella ornata]KAF2277529.1 hypothetical protein EI97DRAFT_416491 [Westerdykella ornata]
MSGIRSAHKAGATRHSFPQKPRGLFVNGVWQCECSPRLPALHLQTKKAGANKGRWFYTCQKQQDDVNRCKFFLWDDDAKPREERALLNNSRSEPEHTNRTPSKPRRVASPPPPYTIEAAPPDARRKRRRGSSEDSDDFGLDSLDSISGDELLAAATSEPPRKATKQDMYTTPRRRLPWDNARGGIPTPQTDESRPMYQLQGGLREAGEFATPSKSRPSGAASYSESPIPSPFQTPTPSRFKEPNTARSEMGLVDEVFQLLQEEKVHLHEQASAKLRAVLGKHSRRAEGNAKAKEVLRLRIKAEEAKNMELSLRNNTLQAELEAARATIDHLNWEKEHGDEG